jgi:aminopeptidase N
VTIGPGGTRQLDIPMVANGGGQSVVKIQLTTADGTPYDEPVELTVTTTGYGAIALVIVGGAFAVLLAAIALRYRGADNMTDAMAGLAVLANCAAPERAAALADFYRRWQHDPLVVDKWLTLQATSTLPGTLPEVERLLAHPAFQLKNPNKVRALIGAFAHANPVRFHAADGGGYRFIAERVRELDPRNPQVAARLAGAFGRWRRFDGRRQELMRTELERILATPKLSADVAEVVGKTLG